MRPTRLVAAAAVVLTAALLPAVSPSAGAAPTSPLYRPLEGFTPTGAQVRVTPDAFSAVRVDLGQARSVLDSAPREDGGAGIVFRVPTPRGGTERFSVQRTSVMAPGLAADNPDIATYSGRSLDSAATTIALDVTPMGMHAAVRGPQGQRAWYVDPAYDRPGTREHLSYFGSSMPEPAEEFAEREAPEIRRSVEAKAPRSTAPGQLVTTKVYRLALTSDPTYADYFGTENVTAEKVTLINRVNQIYDEDLAINLELIEETEELNLDTRAKATGANGPCGAQPCFDPGDAAAGIPSQLDFCDVPTLARNRTVLGQLVGASNYDVGHIALGVNGGGIAYLGVVGADYKGGGCTGLPEPRGDFFAIDYVAHELGHQFSGNHTFNGVQNACSGGNRNGATSVEPGSGSSVMAYAGICLQDDLQPHTDPYFSAETLDEVNAYTGRPTLPVAEVQTVSLRGFGTGDSITLGYPGATPVTVTRSEYTRARITAVVEQLTGEDVLVAGWGYDPYGDFNDYPAPLSSIDETGFQVIFSDSALPEEAPADATDLDSLTVASTSAGVSGFVGETATGGVADNQGSSTVETTNHAPRVDGTGSMKVVPTQTPFMLRGNASDVDADRLTYLWEQLDIGRPNAGTSLVSNNKVYGPLFRVFGTAANVTDEGTLQSPSPGLNIAGTTPTRSFPDLAQVLSGNTNAKTGRCQAPPPLPDDPADYQPVRAKIVECFSEFLPTAAYLGTPNGGDRVMHFRLTTRDGEGGVASRNLDLKVTKSAGPFLVTSQPETRKIRPGSQIRVQWDVNGTKRLSGKVRVLLSTNGGRTFGTTLAKATANDGTKVVRLPAGRTTNNARIMVAANGNYFYAVNDAPLRLFR